MKADAQSRINPGSTISVNRSHLFNPNRDIREIIQEYLNNNRWVFESEAHISAYVEHFEFNDSIEHLKSLFLTRTIKKVGQTRDLEDLIGELLSDVPKKLRSKIKKKILFYESKGFTREEIVAEVLERKNMVKHTYKTFGEYLGMYKKTYLRYVLRDYIDERCRNDSSNISVHCIAKGALDMNGLKAVNDLGGSHALGAQLVMEFSRILKSGRTTQFLKSLGMQVIPFSENGDEFGIILYDDVDIRPLLALIEELYLREMEEADVSSLINFDTPEVRKFFKARGVAPQPGEKFRLSCSFGWGTFGDALQKIDITSFQKYKHAVNAIIREMFDIADERSAENKKRLKDILKSRGEHALYALYTFRADADEWIKVRDLMNQMQSEIDHLRARLDMNEM